MICVKGTLIVIEGLDGSGKATQTQLLLEALSEKKDQQVKKISFPNYNSPSSALVKMYLNGEFAQSAQQVNPYAASCFYSVDRYASYQMDWAEFYQAGGVILADRYTTSNAVHQCAKLPPKEWDAYLQWLFSFEYQKMELPKPDLVLYLDVAPSISQKLLLTRYNGKENQKDLHEKDTAYLQKSRQAAEYCIQALGWKRIVCTYQEKMRLQQDIHQEIIRVVERLLDEKKGCCYG